MWPVSDHNSVKVANYTTHDSQTLAECLITMIITTRGMLKHKTQQPIITRGTTLVDKCKVNNITARSKIFKAKIQANITKCLRQPGKIFLSRQAMCLVNSDEGTVKDK